MVTALRSLLRFLHVEGIVPAPLAQVVPPVAGWKLSSLPRAGLGRISVHQLRHTLAGEMLRRGAPLAEIGQVLRHRAQLTTAISASK